MSASVYHDRLAMLSAKRQEVADEQAQQAAQEQAAARDMLSLSSIGPRQLPQTMLETLVLCVWAHRCGGDRWTVLL